ncbi:Jacalin-related lectin 5 [Hirschfeldia incana]|nr:Jacalin-related lectin 5 [Hirschfeldia incana]
MSWDDGTHAKVNRVQLTFDDVIRSIEVEYEGTNVQPKRRGTVGINSDGFTLSSDEFITHVSGYYRTTFSGDVITALLFRTNKKTYGPYGNQTRNFFSAEAPRNNQIAGFLGNSGSALNSINVHFAPIPPPGSIKPKPVGPGTGDAGGNPKPGGGPGTGENGAGSKPGGPGTGADGDGTKPGGPLTGDDGAGTKPGGLGSGDEAGTKPVGPGTSADGASTKPVGSGTGDVGGDPRPVVPGKMGPLGGSKGNEFDDVGFDGVKKISVGADEFSVTYIKIEYIKDGKVEIREHGTDRGKLKQFSVDYPNDNIVTVGGSYKHIFTYDATLLTSLYFTTSRGFTSPLFGEKTGTDFEFQGENRGNLLGFHGRAGHAIDAIGAYFDTGSQGDPGKGGTRPVVPGKMGPLGGDKGNEFDDVGFDGVKKVTVGADEFSVTYIKIEYVKEGKVEIREHGTSRGQLKEFSVDYPNDNIMAVGGSYNHIFTYDATLLTSLYFTSSRGFTSPLFGEKTGTDFEFQGENRGKLLGFHGRAGHAIDAIGTYFDTGSQGDPGKGGTRPVVPGKMGPLGGDKGNEFDDVGFDGVKKVTVGADEFSVTYIKIDYVKEGKVEIREHGTSRGQLKEFSVDYPNDNIVAVGGSYKHIFTYDATLLTSLYFTTSRGFTSPLFGEKTGTDFEFQGENRGKLLGFHGRAGHAIDAIGAYFDTGSQGDPGKGGTRPVVPGKMGPLGGDKGNEFDDVGFDGVKKVTVGADEFSVTYIKIEYVKEGKVEIREHGTSRGQLKEFSVGYPNDNITTVGGSYNHIFNYDTTLITSLYFTTSRGFTSLLFGKKTGTYFEFKGENRGKLLGFHGRAGYAIDAIGAYFHTGSQGGAGGDPSKGGPKPVVPVKMGPLGGDRGNEFNDVGFDGVKKVTVGADEFSVTYIKIEYAKDGKVEIREHGTSRGHVKEFSVDYPNDNVMAVGGSYNHIFTYDTTLITSLYFTTSRGFTSPLFGKMKGTEFEFKGENGGKLLGFHGRAGHAIDAIGAYFDTGSKPGGNSNSGKGTDSGSSTQRLDVQGGKGGNQWDDGGDYDGVTKITVAVGQGIEQISFEYVKNGQTKEGPARGVRGRRSTIGTFEISHPNEYLLSVKGWSDSSNKIAGIQFKTNTKTSKYYGFEKLPEEESTDILLEVKDKKIVGFHGFADSHVNSLGAYIAPVAN